jgi:hypothetical protein
VRLLLSKWVHRDGRSGHCAQGIAPFLIQDHRRTDVAAREQRPNEVMIISEGRVR